MSRLTRPDALDIDAVDPAALDRERAVLSEQARASGKPEAIIEKMVDGRIRKYYEEVVLLEQVWVHDGESRVRAVVAEVGRQARPASSASSSAKASRSRPPISPRKSRRRPASRRSNRSPDRRAEQERRVGAAPALAFARAATAARPPGHQFPIGNLILVAPGPCL